MEVAVTDMDDEGEELGGVHAEVRSWKWRG